MSGEVAPRGGDEAARNAQLRASHADRDRVVEVLRMAAGDGRLDTDELDERLERALTARTLAELAALTTDLPAGSGPGGAEAPRDLVRIECRSASTRREGSWVVPRRMEVSVRSGRVTLDFTEAVITLPSLHIDADVGSGSLLIIARPGVVVDAQDVSIRSGRVRNTARWRPEVPVILQVRVSGQVGSGHIVARPPQRAFWDWLRRRPRPYASALSQAPHRELR